MNQVTPRYSAIQGCPGYAVSDHGDVLSFKYGRFELKKCKPTKDGYHRVSLCVGSKVLKPHVHTLVLENFVGPRPTPKHEACHGNGVGTVNVVDNLRWGTPKENAADRTAHGRTVTRKGSDALNTNLTDEMVLEIRRANGTQRGIAQRFGCSQMTIQRIKTRQTWRHLEE